MTMNPMSSPSSVSRMRYRSRWNLATLAVGIALLIGGSFYYQAPDWDIPISLIMAIFAYFTAPWSMRVLVERKWRLWPLMLFFTWFTVDGCYAIYWYFRNPVALEQMRDANFPASLTLYGMCGLVWFYRGSLKQFFADTIVEVRNHFPFSRTNKK
jgi:hypothetical protein